jgi:HAD superfamily hydrolase (TIGR01509 family)
LAETERDVHRISFNKAFKDQGLTCEWSVEEYGVLLQTGGGKERMTVYFNDKGWPESVPEAERQDFVKNLHKIKTAGFKDIVMSGAVPLRPGVERLVDEALKNGVKVAVCSTSNEDAVTTIVRELLGEDRLAQMPIFAGDVVPKKKPAPDVYLLAAEKLGVDPARCWVVEDSEIGCAAGVAAGMKVVVTKSVYTEEEDFAGAQTVIKDLDNGLDGPINFSWLNYKASSSAYTPPKSTENAELFGAPTDYGKMFNKILDGKGTGMPF